MSSQIADLIIQCSQMSQWRAHMPVILLAYDLAKVKCKEKLLNRRKDKSIETSPSRFVLMTRKLWLSSLLTVSEKRMIILMNLSENTERMKVSRQRTKLLCINSTKMAYRTKLWGQLRPTDLLDTMRWQIHTQWSTTKTKVLQSWIWLGILWREKLQSTSQKQVQLKRWNRWTLTPLRIHWTPSQYRKRNSSPCKSKQKPSKQSGKSILRTTTGGKTLVSSQSSQLNQFFNTLWVKVLD